MNYFAFGFVCFVVVLMAAPSLQYGTVFTDTVNPVKQDTTFVQRTSSQVVTAGVLDVGFLNINNAAGFNADVVTASFKGRTLSFEGLLGAEIGGENADNVNVNSVEGTYGFGRDVNVDMDNIHVETVDDISFASGINFHASADEIDFEGLFQWELESASGNVNIESVETDFKSDALNIKADDVLLFNSKAGDIQVSSNSNVKLSADTFNSESLLGFQIASTEGDINVAAGKVVNARSGNALFTSFGPTSFSSATQSVDFAAADGLAVSAPTTTLTAAEDINVDTSADQFSDFVTSAPSLTLNLGNLNSVSDRVETIADFATINVATFNLLGDASVRVGSEATNDLNLLATGNTMTFSSTKDLDVIADDSLSASFTRAATFQSGRDIRVSTGDLTATMKDVTIGATNVDFVGDLELKVNTATLATSSTTSSLFQGRHVLINANTNDLTSTSTANVDIFSTHSSDFLGNTQVLINAGNDAYVRSGNIRVLSKTDTTFKTNLGSIEVAASSGNEVFGTTSVALVAGDDVNVYSHGNVNLYSKSDLTFTLTDSFIGLSDNFVKFDTRNLAYTVPNTFLAKSTDNLKFISGGTTTFTGGSDLTVGATSSTITADGITFTSSDLTVTGNTITWGSEATTNIQSASNAFTAVNDVSFDAEQTTTFTSSGPVTINSKSFTSTTSAESSSFSGASTAFTASNNILFDLEGDLTVNGQSSILITSQDKLLFQTGEENDDHINFNAFASILGTSNSDFFVTGGQIYQEAANAISSISNTGITITATADDAWTRFVADRTLTFNTDNGDLAFTAGQDTEISTYYHDSIALLTQGAFALNGDKGVNISSIAQTYATTGALAVNANEINLNAQSAKFSSLGLTIQTGVSTLVASEQSVTYTAGAAVSATAAQLVFNSNSSSYFQASGITITAAGGLSDVKFLSGGASNTIAQAGDIIMSSAANYEETAGRTIQFHAINGPLSFLARLGDFTVKSSDDIHFEGLTGFTLTTTQSANGNGTAPITFTSGETTSILSHNEGVLITADGVLHSGSYAVPRPGIVVRSTDAYGNIIFDAARSTLYQETRDALNVIAGRDQFVFGAEGYSVLANNNLSFSSKKHFNAFAKNGINFNAGSNGNPANLNFNIGGNTNVQSSDAITIHSQGPVPQAAIIVESNKGSIRFSTSNGRNVDSVATDNQPFTAGRNMRVNATRDLDVTSETGSISLFGTTAARFSTEGGPIVFTTKTGTPNGAININSNTSSINIVSGNDFDNTATDSISFQAQTGLFYKSYEGRLDVVAGETSSEIQLLSAGSLFVVSNGSRIQPEDGIYMQASNNIEFKAETTVALNAIEKVTIGDITRPLIRINAGGSTSVTGVDMTSDGAIYTATDNTWKTAVDKLFQVIAQNSVTVKTGGETTIRSTGSTGIGENINLKATLGTLKVHGDNTAFTATEQIKGTTSGVLTITSTGLLPEHGIEMDAGKDILFTAKSVLDISTTAIDADLSDSATFTVKGNGLVQNVQGEGGSTRFFARGGSFTGTAVSGTGLTVSTRLPDAPMTIRTLGNSNSSIIVSSGSNSDLEFVAGNILAIGAKQTSLTGRSDVSITSETTSPHGGVIEVYATGSITGTAQRDLTLQGDDSVQIITTGSTLGVGAPITLTATDRITFTQESATVNAEDSFIVQNTPGEGGSVTFYGAKNVLLSAVSGVYFNADHNLNFISVGDSSYTLLSSVTEVAGDVTYTAAGKTGAQAYGIFLENIANNDRLLLSSHPFGTMEIYGRDGVTFTTPDPMNFNADRSMRFVSHGKDNAKVGTAIGSSSTTVLNLANQNNNLFVQGKSGVVMTAATAINVQSFGIDNNGVAGTRLESFATGGDIFVGAPAITTASSTLINVASNINLNAANTLTLSNDGGSGNTAFQSTGAMNVDSANGFVVNAARDLNFLSNGAIRFNASSTINMFARDTLLLQTQAPQANISLTAAGANYFGLSTGATKIVYIETVSPHSGADISFWSTQGRIEIRDNLGANPVLVAATSNDFTVSIANFGDFLVGDATTPNSDVRVTALGTVSLTAQQNTVPPGQALFITATTGNFFVNADAGDILVEAAGTTRISASTLTVEAGNNAVEGNQVRAGDMWLDANSGLSFTSNVNSISLSAGNPDPLVANGAAQNTMSVKATNNILIRASTRIDLAPQSGAGINSRVLIPTVDNGSDRIRQCYTGNFRYELFHVSSAYFTNTGLGFQPEISELICMCEDYNSTGAPTGNFRLTCFTIDEFNTV